MSGSIAKATTTAVACRLKELQDQGLQRLRQGAVFWPYSWRSELCTCTSCKVARDLSLNITLRASALANHFAWECDSDSCNHVIKYLKLFFF